MTLITPSQYYSCIQTGHNGYFDGTFTGMGMGWIKWVTCFNLILLGVNLVVIFFRTQGSYWLYMLASVGFIEGKFGVFFFFFVLTFLTLFTTMRKTKTKFMGHCKVLREGVSNLPLWPGFVSQIINPLQDKSCTGRRAGQVWARVGLSSVNPLAASPIINISFNLVIKLIYEQSVSLSGLRTPCSVGGMPHMVTLFGCLVSEFN